MQHCINDLLTLGYAAAARARSSDGGHYTAALRSAFLESLNSVCRCLYDTSHDHRDTSDSNYREKSWSVWKQL